MTSGRPRGRTLVVGLESAELSLIEEWVRDGSLPFLGSLLDSCPLVNLATPIHVLQIAVWPSLLTGASPGRHGRYVLWKQIRSGTYTMQAQSSVRGSLRRYEEFLSDHGVSCALADVPADMHIPGHPALQIVDWGTEFRFGNCRTEPRRLAARISREVGAYPISPFRHSGDSQSDHLELARLLEEGLRLKGDLTRWLLRQPGLDHVFSVFAEMHKGAHWLWKYIDRNHVDYEDSPPVLRDALKRIYVGVDRELAAIAAELGPHDNLIVLSEQGMQANYRGNHLVDLFLAALGLLSTHRPLQESEGVRRRIGNARGRRAGARSTFWRAIRASRALVPETVKAPWRLLRDRSDIDWHRTRVFRLPTDRNTYLRVNLRGREPLGLVEPGAEYEALLDLLETELRALRNGATGAPAVAEIFRMRQLFPGDRADDLPDLAVQWTADAPIDSLQSDTVGTLSLSIRELRSGNHRPEGFLLARGPAFATGRASLSGDILQVPATLLKVHGVPRPAQFERSPLPIFSAYVASPRGFEPRLPP